MLKRKAAQQKKPLQEITAEKDHLLKEMQNISTSCPRGSNLSSKIWTKYGKCKVSFDVLLLQFFLKSGLIQINWLN